MDSTVASPTIDQSTTPTAATNRISGGVMGNPDTSSGASPGEPDDRSLSATGTSIVTRSVRGVTDTSIKIGIGYPDLAVFANIKSNWQDYDTRMVEAVVDRWRRQGLVPVHGRDIELAYHKYALGDPSAQRSACLDFVQDKKVFAVVSVGALGGGRDCLAREFKTPVITNEYGGSTTDALLENTAPFLFTPVMSTTRMMRNFAHWAHEGGYLKGKTIGLYYFKEGSDPEGIANALRGELIKLGYKIAVEASTTNGTGGPDDQIAVQRFRSGGVDVALLVVSLFNKTNFMQYAESQRYKPAYLDSDYIWASHDQIGDLMPPSQYHGTFAMTAAHMGEWGSNELSAETMDCIKTYERFSGEEVAGPGNRFAMNLLTCDNLTTLLLGLQAAGRDLTPLGLVHGIESAVRNVRGALHGNITFAPGKHHGEDSWRTIRYDASCRTETAQGCWKIVGDGAFRPLWVP